MECTLKLMEQEEASNNELQVQLYTQDPYVYIFEQIHDNTKNAVQPEIFARRKFLPISPPALIGKNFIHEFFLQC